MASPWADASREMSKLHKRMVRKWPLMFKHTRLWSALMRRDSLEDFSSLKLYTKRSLIFKHTFFRSALIRKDFLTDFSSSKTNNSFKPFELWPPFSVSVFVNVAVVRWINVNNETK